MSDDMPEIDIFLSYNSTNKPLALVIKESLKKYDCSVFLAPDDVAPGKKFLSTIYEKIQNCQIFIVILSTDSSASEYLDHETGIALALKKPVLPICFDNFMPYGFLREDQGIVVSDTNIEEKITEIFDAIMNLTNGRKKYVDLIISHLEQANSFNDALRWAQKLNIDFIFNNEQITKIIEARINNSQIYNSFMALPEVDRIIEKHIKILPSNTREEYMEAMSL